MPQEEPMIERLKKEDWTLNMFITFFAGIPIIGVVVIITFFMTYYALTKDDQVIYDLQLNDGIRAHDISEIKKQIEASNEKIGIIESKLKKLESHTHRYHDQAVIFPKDAKK